MTATFMPKPFTDRTGTRDAPAPVAVAGRRPRCSPTPTGGALGLSPRRYSFLAGILEHASGDAGGAGPDRQLLQADRRGLDPVRGDLVAAPRQLRRQRPHPLRARPRRHRIELRGGDGSANPYLALAAALAAGLDGIDRGLRPGRAGRGPDAPVRADLPPTLLHAVDALSRRPGDRRRRWTPSARASRSTTPGQARGVLRLARHGRPLGARPLPDRFLTTDPRIGEVPCAGSSGSICAIRSSTLSSGELLAAMLGHVVERGPDSAGVAVYGDSAAARPVTPLCRAAGRYPGGAGAGAAAGPAGAAGDRGRATRPWSRPGSVPTNSWRRSVPLCRTP